MDYVSLRRESIATAKSLGYPVNEALPLLDEIEELRSVVQTVDRVLGLFACVAVSYGFGRAEAQSWLSQEGLDGALTAAEWDFLNKGSPAQNAAYQWQVECLWALTWAASYHDVMDFRQSCSEGFIAMFPDIKGRQSSSEFRAKAKMRSIDEVGKVADLVYCLHWGVRDCQKKGIAITGSVEAGVIQERRRAVEWLISQDPWDEVSLDT